MKYEVIATVSFAVDIEEWSDDDEHDAIYEAVNEVLPLSVGIDDFDYKRVEA